MFEFPTIQQRGFRNVREGGRITGFQVAIRSKYYRGLWMSQLRSATVTVDGTAYEGDQVTWTIDGIAVPQSELAKRGDVHWDNQELAILTVRKPGGLELGLHDVAVAYQYSASYLPPRIDLQDGGGEPRRMVIGR